MAQAADPFEMIRNFWANVPGMQGVAAPQMPSFDPKELEKRMGELKQVKQWLEMNLNMLSLQINTMEMQLAAVKGFKTASGGEAEEKPDMAKAAGDAAGAASNAGAEAFAQGAQALQGMPWANPGDWLKSMQAVFQQAPASGAGKPAGAKKAAAKSASRKPAATRARKKS